MDDERIVGGPSLRLEQPANGGAIDAWTPRQLHRFGGEGDQPAPTKAVGRPGDNLPVNVLPVDVNNFSHTL